IDGWVMQGRLSSESLLQRLDESIATSNAIPFDAKPTLQRVFESVSNSEGLLPESALLSLLQTKAALPPSPELVEASKVLFEALVYLSSFPMTGPKVGSHVEGLTLAELSRALVWILPRNYQYVIEEGNFSRVRTPADHRRLIFQSLALSHEHALYDASLARKLALRNAFDIDREYLADLCLTNHDDDGDEIYHDLLDVLYSTQPDVIPGISPAHRDAFRPAAKTISAEKHIPLLRTLGIPAERFVSLVRLLLATQFKPPIPAEQQQQQADIAIYTPAARSIAAAFTTPGTHDLITHPQFDHALAHLAPYLFDSLYQFLSTTFLGQTYFLVAGNLDRPSQLPLSTPTPSPSASTLTLPRASQLTTFLAGAAYFPWFYLHAHFSATPTTPPPTAASLARAIQSAPPGIQTAVVLLSGRDTSTLQTVIFGLFTPHPTADMTSIQHTHVPDHVGTEGCALFQLAPTHGVFRGRVGKPGWRVLGEETIVFGEVGAGVCLRLRPGPEREGRIWFDEAKADRERERDGWTYEADVQRGDWLAEFELERIEIWSERE
ncbi:hypothetical protein B0H67DRAFT_467885, partial [Lasiosphaeris hirsuta]